LGYPIGLHLSRITHEISERYGVVLGPAFVAKLYETDQIIYKKNDVMINERNSRNLIDALAIELIPEYFEYSAVLRENFAEIYNAKLDNALAKLVRGKDRKHTGFGAPEPRAGFGRGHY